MELTPLASALTLGEPPSTRWPARLLARLLAVVLSVGLVTSQLALGQPAEAANACQHFTHPHYHFPFAHRDTHRYDGSHWHYDQYHYHHYFNENHNTPYEKRC